MARPGILVVEPDEDVAATIALMLESFGFRVRVAHDGPGAREILNKKTAGIAVVVVAMILHGEDGTSLADHIRDLRLPLVMISANDEAMNRAAEQGMQLLQKP